MNCEPTTTYGCINLAISALALLVSAISIIISVRIKKNNMKMSFFAEYTKRYQEIEIGLMSDCEKTRYKYYHIYFDLCSEEYYLHSCGCLPKDVWDMWKDGMKLMVKVKELQTAWKSCSQLYNKNFNEFFNDMIIKTNN